MAHRGLLAVRVIRGAAFLYGQTAASHHKDYGGSGGDTCDDQCAGAGTTVTGTTRCYTAGSLKGPRSAVASGGRGGLWGRREVGKEAPPPPPPPLGARHGVTLGTGGFVGCHDGLGGGPAGDGAVYEADGGGSSGDVPDGLHAIISDCDTE